MNATPRVSQSALGNDASQSNATASDSAASGAPGQDFAKALSDAGAKPGRKLAMHERTGADASGGHLPSAGNFSPSALPPPPPAAAAPAPAASAVGPPVPGTSAAVAPAAVTTAAPLAPSNAAPISVAADVGPADVTAPPATAEISASEAALTSATASTAPSNTGAAAVNTSVSAASTDSAPDPAIGAVTSAGAAKVSETASRFDASLAGSMPLVGGAAVRTTTTPAARTPLPASTSRAASPPGTLAAFGAADSPDAGANAAATAAATVHGPAPATNSVSPADDPTPPDTSVKSQDAAQANVAQIPTLAVEIPTIQSAAAAASATIAQELVTRGSTAAAQRLSGDDAVPSLSLNSSNAAAGAAQLLANPPIPTDAAQAPVLNVAARVDSSEFGQGVATQVSLMVDRNLNSASLQVNPPALGPIEVRIALQGGHAQVWMTSHSAATRDALESSASKLREMLGTQGFGQVSVDISQRSFQERSSQSQNYDTLPPAERSAAIQGAAAPRAIGPIPRAASGRVDAYA